VGNMRITEIFRLGKKDGDDDEKRRHGWGWGHHEVISGKLLVGGFHPIEGGEGHRPRQN